ncbi:MAG: glycosyltransferase family A protein [Microbacterium sp.]
MSAPHHPRVSIVVRTKNRPTLLRRALESITSQTCTAWEAVIVNDGGDAERVDAVIAALPDDDRHRVRAIHAPASRGRWVSANAGVLATSAELLVLHDDDDTWHPQFLERSIAYLDAHPERAGVVSRIEIVWEQRVAGRMVEVRREPFQPHLAAPTLGDTLLYNRFVPIAFVYRRSLHEELGLYDESLPVIGDWAFNLKVLAHGPLDYLGERHYAFWHQRTNDTGESGNSVVAARNDHAKHDALVRDAALREHIDANGLGLALYLTKFVDQRLVDVERGLHSDIERRTSLRVRALEFVARHSKRSRADT